MSSDPHNPDAQGAVLVLPGGYGDGPTQAARMAAAGLRVIGASSVADDPARARYAAWLTLPHVTDPGFDAALAEAVAVHGVGQIHASHFMVWRRLNDVLPSLAPQVRLTQGRTYFDLETDYRALRALIAEAPRPAPGGRPALSPVEAAGFLRAAMAIPGESYEAKLMPIMEAARRAPAGDLVEVGCLFGRTAALLAMLAARYGLGQVLCVDPWRPNDQGSDTLTAASAAFDWDDWRRIFEINVAPFARGRLNYIHAPSVQGAAAYAAGGPVVTEAFGVTAYEGAIALLHLDGNHAHDHILADTRAWTPHVKPGGWIVFDDYEWDWGDGPRVVGDAYVQDNAARVQTRFVAGGALFVQLKS